MFRQRLDELVNLQHPLARLAQHIDWQVFEQKWAPHFSSSRGRPATPTRMIAGLLYLQHTFALSDAEAAVSFGSACHSAITATARCGLATVAVVR